MASPSTTRGLYLNLRTAASAALSKIELVDSTTKGSRTVPVRVTVNSTITCPDIPRDIALRG